VIGVLWLTATIGTRVIRGGAAGLWLFVSMAHPVDRRPQCEHRKKIAPGSHDTPNS
jgi:hypothetical protein